MVIGDVEDDDPNEAEQEGGGHCNWEPSRALHLQGVLRDHYRLGPVIFLLLSNPRLWHGREITREDVAMGTRILVVDNYDSFVFNLVQYLQQLGAECTVVRNDEIPASAALEYDGVLISPGPGAPEEAGISMKIIQTAAENRKPLLGVCLGHQAIATAYGATVTRAPELLHGKTSQVNHDGTGIFNNIPTPFTATRYHSLAVLPETLPEEIIVSGKSESGVVMALRHRSLPIFGVQFHPESVLTEHGHQLLANWLVECGMADAVERAKGLAPVINR